MRPARAGCERCGNRSWMRFAGRVGSRSSTEPPARSSGRQVPDLVSRIRPHCHELSTPGDAIVGLGSSSEGRVVAGCRSSTFCWQRPLPLRSSMYRGYHLGVNCRSSAAVPARLRRFDITARDALERDIALARCKGQMLRRRQLAEVAQLPKVLSTSIDAGGHPPD